MVVGNFAEEIDTIVIGSGPGGYVAAIRAAQMGQSVVVVEKGDIGGICLNVGCIPSKALINAGHRYQEALDASTFGITTTGVQIDFTKTQKWKDEKVVRTLTQGVEMLLKKNKVTIVRGTALFNDRDELRVVGDDFAQSYRFKNAIIATGTRPAALKGFPWGKRVVDSTGGLNLPEIPKRFVVIGGGYIGAEIAGAYANLGSEVTILHRSPTILKSFDADMVKLVTDRFAHKNVKVLTNVAVKGAVEHDASVTVTYEAEGVSHDLEVDYVMVATGRIPNTDELNLAVAGIELDDKGLVKVDKQGRTTNPAVFAIGDIVPGPALAHKASYEAKIAAEAISGKAVAVDYVAIPAICFTDPELATVGLSEAEAKKQGIDVKVARFPFGANGRALSLDQAEGFVRLVSDKKTGLLIGGQVAGAGASDLIAEISLAIEARMVVEDLSLTIHAHPTLSETILDASELALGMPIHI